MEVQVLSSTLGKHSTFPKYYIMEKIEVNSINIARLLSELEGSYVLTKYMGFEDDMKILDEMKKRFYKLYFKLVKEEKNTGN